MAACKLSEQISHLQPLVVWQGVKLSEQISHIQPLVAWQGVKLSEQISHLQPLVAWQRVKLSEQISPSDTLCILLETNDVFSCYIIKLLYNSL